MPNLPPAGRAPDPVVALLVDAVRGTAGAWRPDWDVEHVLDVAEAHRVTPALARVAADIAGAPAALGSELQAMRTEQVLRHLTTLADLQRLGAALDDAGVAWVVVKGPVAAATAWPAPDMRDYLDLDVVVDPTRLPEVLDLLEDLGAEQLDVNWGLIRRQLRAELSFVLPHGTLLDLHWHPVNAAPLRRALGWEVGPLLARRRLVDVGSLVVPTLDAADTAVHMAYHAVHSGGYRLLWLADVAYALAAADPGEVVARARAGRLELMLAVAADRAARVLGSSVPALPGLPRGAWRRALAAVDRRRVVPPPGVGGRSGRLRVSSTRWSTPSSVAALAAGAASHVVLRRDAGVRDDNPLHTADGDLAARADYLEAVRSGA